MVQVMSTFSPQALAQITDAGDYRQWTVLGILFLIGLGFAVFNIILSSIVGPKRRGKTKESVYESGVDPVGSTHRRFNVRFYLVAMIFLVFDVEVLFFIPWITIFPKLALFKQLNPTLALSAGVMFTTVIVFTAIVLLAYIYAWAKGVFKWD